MVQLNETYQEFAVKLRNTREEKRLSQQALADLIGVSRESIVFWESAMRYPTITNLGKLERELGTKLK